MKKLLLFIAVTVFFCGCNSKPTNDKYNIYNSVYYANGLEEYYYYDEILTEKSIINFDSSRLRNDLEKMLPYKTIIANYGDGYKSFYLAVMVGSKTKYRLLDGVHLRPEMGYLSSACNKTIICPFGNDEIINSVNLFEYAFPDIENIFSTKPGKIGSKIVPSMKLYELNVALGKNGEVVKPWEVKETKFEKFRPIFVKNLSRKDVSEEYYIQDYHSDNKTEEVKHNLARQEFEIEYLKKKSKSGDVKALFSNPYYAGSYSIWGRNSEYFKLQDGWDSFYKKLFSIVDMNAVENHGTVIAEVFIDKKGDVVGTQLLKGLNDKCDEAAITALKQVKSIPQDTLISFVVPIYFETAEEKNDIDLNIEFVRPELVSKENHDFRIGDEINFHFKITNKAKSKFEYNEIPVVLCINEKHYWHTNIIFKEFTGAEHWAYWKAKEKGKYSYTLCIDPDNRLGDKDLSNNFIKGTFEVK